MGLLAALQFLTVVPIKCNFTNQEIGRSSTYFPVVGLFIGLVLLGLNYILKLILPPALVNLLLLSVLVVVSGGLHLDGLADTMDGMAGHRTPDRRLEIMRDSRIGGFGAIALVLVLLVEYVFLNSIQGNWFLYSLVLAPVLSRWAMVSSIFAHPYARSEGLGKAFKQVVNWQQFWIATLISVIVAVGLFRVAGMVVMAFTWLIFTLVAFYFRGRLKGLTGDTYGAINEIAFIAVLVIVNVLSYKGWLL
jgi:adenosylcobinamide-GDP ribazoletransferase